MNWLLILGLLTAQTWSSTTAVLSPKSNSKFSHSLYATKTGDEKIKVTETSREQLSVVAATDEKPISLNAFDLCLCGALATAFGDFCLHPIDTIKVTQQTAVGALNIVDTARQILAKNGPMGFYQGVVPYLTADGISGAIKFATFELSKVFVEARIPVSYHPFAQFVCAAGAMLACSVVLVPGEVLKTRLQAGAVKNLAEGISQTLKQDGIGGLFAGYYATLVRDIPYTMLELGIYENIKTLARKIRKKQDLDQVDELAAAAFTGGVTAYLTTPLDVIKTKLMMQSTTGGQYSGVMDALTSMYKTGGLDALFVGSAARVAWLLPFTTIYLGVYEAAKKKLLEYKRAQAQAKR